MVQWTKNSLKNPGSTPVVNTAVGDPVTTTPWQFFSSTFSH
jgi:hypothetical protein